MMQYKGDVPVIGYEQDIWSEMLQLLTCIVQISTIWLCRLDVSTGGDSNGGV